MKEVLKEADYKVATIEWLVKKGLLEDDAVLINELPVDNFSRRADLVVANGKLHAYEIKSDADSLTRLEGQISTYLSFFDKVTVICSSKYTQKALFCLPSAVEIVELSYLNKKATLKVVRRGKTKEIKNHFNFLSFVEKKVLVSSLKKQGLACHLGETRESIYHKFGLIPKKTWRNVVLTYLKNKYRATNDFFFLNKKEEIKTSDLVLLSPKHINTEKKETDTNSNHVDFSIEKNFAYNDKLEKHGIDISENMYRMGFITTSPVKIIPRITK